MFKRVFMSDESVQVMLEKLDELREEERRAYNVLRECVRDKECDISYIGVYYSRARSLVIAHENYFETIRRYQDLLNRLRNDREDYRVINIAEDRNGKHYLEEWEDEG